MADLESTRVAFVEALTELMDADPRVVMVSADSVAVFRAAPLLSKYPERVIEAGIGEQNAVMIAAGLASCGLIPFVCAYAGFSVMRACEQMRTFVAYPRLNVKFFGANGGMFAGEREGVTHQFYEDLGILRSMMGFTVIAPADAKQTKLATLAAPDIEGPVYVRIGSGRDPAVYRGEARFAPGMADVLRSDGTDALILGHGHMLAKALEAAETLSARGIKPTVVNVSTLKPLDEAALLPLMRACKRVVVAEDHNLYGALGSAVCELAASKCPCRVERVALMDGYPESGAAEELLVKYGLTADAIVRAATAE